MIVFGDIKDFDGNIAKVEVQEHDNEVYECYMLQPLTGKSKVDLPYAKGDQVCVFLSDGRNIILGAIYNDQDTRDADAGDDTFVFKTKKVFVKAQDGTQFNDGSNGGLVKVQEAENNLNQIKDYLDIMKQAVSAGINAVGAAMSANGATGKTAFEAAMAAANINFSDMENKDVKH